MSTITITCMVCGLGYDIHHNLTPPARFIKVVSNCPNCGTRNILQLEEEVLCPDCFKPLDKYPEWMFCVKCSQIWKECAYRYCHELFKPTVNPPSRHRYHTVECRLLENIELEKIKRPVRKKKAKKLCHNCGRNPVPRGNHWLCDPCYRGGEVQEEYSLNL